eukprot:1418350-Rhodomonas_salina.1
MRASDTAALPYLVAVTVCAASAPRCTTAGALQPVGYLRVGEGMEEGSAEELGLVLRFCVVGEEQVRLELKVLGQDQPVADLPSLTQSVAVDCVPCQVRGKG